MGFGGALMWTALARNLKRAYPEKKIGFVYRRSYRDFKKGRDYRDKIIFKNNPEISFIWGSFVFEKLRWFFSESKWLIVDMERPEYKYWTDNTPEKIAYRQDGHAIEMMCRVHGIQAPELQPTLCLTRREKRRADQVLRERDLKSGHYLCIEPCDPPPDGLNKAWFWDRWESYVIKCQEYFRENAMDWKIVQLGAPEGSQMPGVVSLKGDLSFRESGEVLRQSAGLICYEGGLVHLARAMNTSAVVLISAFMPRGVASYPGNWNLYHEIECQSCGLKTPCPIDRECMRRISVEDVWSATEVMIEKFRKA